MLYKIEVPSTIIIVVRKLLTTCRVGCGDEIKSTTVLSNVRKTPKFRFEKSFIQLKILHERRVECDRRLRDVRKNEPIVLLEPTLAWASLSTLNRRTRLIGTRARTRFSTFRYADTSSTQSKKQKMFVSGARASSRWSAARYVVYRVVLCRRPHRERLRPSGCRNFRETRSNSSSITCTRERFVRVS